ncbi:MAG: ferredoxin [Patescibacteria group bacterium]
MKIKVDPTLCIGCGLCAATAPEVFQINNEGKSEVKVQTDDRELINRVIADCPTQAISTEE